MRRWQCRHRMLMPGGSRPCWPNCGNFGQPIRRPKIELLGRLHESDPSLWPLVVEQFRATLAYRHAMEQVSADGGSRGTVPFSLTRKLGQSPEQVQRLPPVDAVQQASYRAPVDGSGAEQLAGAIAALERETPAVPTTPREVADGARLRMLYTIVGRREDAARPIPAHAGRARLRIEGDGGAWRLARRRADAGRRPAGRRGQVGLE